MRIPTSRRDHRYRQRRAAAVTTSANRRVLRLVLVMVLVILVMRQAADPRVYEALFRAPSQDPFTAQPAPPSWTEQPTADGALAGAAEGPAASTDAAESGAEDFYHRLVAALEEATAQGLLRFLARADTSSVQGQSDSPPLATPTPLPAELQSGLEAAADAMQTGDPDAAQPPLIRWDEAEPRQRLLAALDRWAIARVDPAAIWKAADSLAFYRLLQEPSPAWLAAQTPAQPGVISLLQQPEVYLQRRLVILGSVARAINRTAAENPFGVTAYWELWLRPRDGSEHPLVVFTVDVPPAVAAVGAEATLHEGPLIWFDGVYLKRLAYNSAAGRELAPALVGRMQLADASEQAADPAAPLPAPAPAWATSPETAPSGWMLVALAAVLAIAATLLIYYQTTKEARRSRALRQASLGPVGSPLTPPNPAASDSEGVAAPPRPAGAGPAAAETETDR